MDKIPAPCLFLIFYLITGRRERSNAIRNFFVNFVSQAACFGTGRLFSVQQHEQDAVNDACANAVHDDGTRDDEHFGGGAGDEALWLCQDRQTNFFKII